MAKSLDEIYRQMELERLQKLENERIEEKKISDERDKKRQEWQKLTRMYESISLASTAVAAGAGGTKLTPSIVISYSTLNLGDTIIGGATISVTYSVSALRLSEDLTITIVDDVNFQLQIFGETASNPIILPHVNGTINPTIMQISFFPLPVSPSIIDVFNTQILHSSSDLNRILSVSASIIETSITITNFDPSNFSPFIDTISVNINYGSIDVTERGIIWSLDPDATVDGVEPDVYKQIDGDTGSGDFTFTNVNIEAPWFYTNVYVKAYAITEIGTFYSNYEIWIPELCVAKGTKILLSNGLHKNIEDIEYEDSLSVWDFDSGEFTSSNPLWIKQAQTANKYNLLKFSDGSELKTISQHRIFNKEAGMFTYPMTNETPIGTTTFNEDGNEITLIEKAIINEKVEYYNIITKKHMNLFTNGILTSCRYNNIYPISNMKFIKDNRVLRSREEFVNITDNYYKGLRLSEQVFNLEDIQSYINRLQKNEIILEIY